MQEQKLGDSIKIVGKVEIRNGDTVINAKNRFTQSILAHISNILMLGRISGTYVGNYFWNGPIHNYNIYIGTDTGTLTAYNTTALIVPIGTPPGTAPNTITGSTSNPSNGVFQMSIVATWNDHTVSGTVGEMALYLELTTALKGYQWGLWADNLVGSYLLGSRLSSADGSFSPFTIDNTKPLVITWTIKVSF